jgi:putative nucleotidyltransferase with HDIG domain
VACRYGKEIPMTPDLLDPAAFAWPELGRRYAPLRALEGCPQDPIHHAEGDVFVHTGMVVRELLALPAFRSLAEAEQSVVYAAALLHDIAKPPRTVREDGGRVSSPGHARLGERMARAFLYEAAPDAPFAVTERIARLVRHHGLPLWFLEKEDPERAVIAASLVADTRLVALLAEADARGRVCPDTEDLLERIALFGEFCRETGCWGQPRAFASDHSRFVYFRRGGSPDYAAFDDTRCAALLMAGLPGAGKDTWIRQNAPELPVVSLDALRRELQVDPSGNQGAVVRAARERAKEHLRAERRFVWNATNVTRQMRRQLVDVFADYGARVEIVYVHAPLPRLLERNRRREHGVPDAAVRDLLGKLEVPDATEAHGVRIIE